MTKKKKKDDCPYESERAAFDRLIRSVVDLHFEKGLPCPLCDLAQEQCEGERMKTKQDDCPYEDKDLRAAWRRGRKDHAAGKTIVDNPYPRSAGRFGVARVIEPADAWDEGFTVVERELKYAYLPGSTTYHRARVGSNVVTVCSRVLRKDLAVVTNSRPRDRKMCVHCKRRRSA